jgi:protein-arginine kinase activator protein McsA
VNENQDIDPNENELSIASVEELEALLQEAIEQEDYERASEIRDELNKRS